MRDWPGPSTACFQWALHTVSGAGPQSSAGLFVYLEGAEIKYKTHFIVLWCVLCRLAFPYRKWQKIFMISEILVVFSLFRFLRLSGRLSVAVENMSDFSLGVCVGLSVLVCPW